MKEELLRLVTLQKYDRQIIEIDTHLNNLKQQIEKDEARLNKAKAQFADKQDELNHRKLDSNKLDLEIKQAETRYKECSYQLMSLKDTKSYDTMKNQLMEIKEDISIKETYAIDLLNTIEELEKTLSMYSEKIAEEALRIQGLKDHADKERESRCEEKDELLKRRMAFASELTAGTMSKYQRLLKLPNGVAMATLQGRTCTGCYSSITMDDLEAVKLMDKLIQCGSCQRIIYIPSLLGSPE